MAPGKLRLVHITHDLAIGGLQRVVVNLCRTIDRDRFDVSVLCLRALGPLAPEIERLGIPVSLIRQTGRTDYFSFLKVARFLREERADVIHTHNTQPLIDGTIGALLAGVPTVVHTDHGRTFPDKRRYMWAERAMSRFVYRIVGVSDQTSKALVDYEKIPWRRIETIQNGIDATVFPCDIDIGRKRCELGLGGERPILGVAARLVEVKGLCYLVRAMPSVLERHPDAVLLIAGEGPLDGELKAEAERAAVSGHVRFLGPRVDIPELLKVLDVYVQPSLSEGLPMGLLEAMGAGCPIVATSVGGVPAAIQDGVNGRLVPPKDPEALATGVLELLQSEGLQRRYVAAGLRAFHERYTTAIMTRRYERLYLRES